MELRKKLLGLATLAFVSSLGFGAVAVNASAAETVETAKFEMVTGAQIRLADPAGIRFVTYVNEAYKTELAKTYSTENYTWVWGTELTFTETTGSTWTIDVKTQKWIDNDSRWYTALVDIPETDYLTEITAESYVKIYDADNTLVDTETVSNAQTRSIAWTASWALNDGYNEDILYTYTNAIPDASVELDKEGVSYVSMGEEIQLTATAQPTGYGIAWRSSDEAVATVDKNGKVTAVGAGVATITARLGNASDSYKVGVASSPESALITTLNRRETNPEATRQKLTMDNVVGDKTDVYGISEISKENSSTMYIWLSFDYMEYLFADRSVKAITFDVILSIATAKIQGIGNEELQNVVISSNGSYHTYTITISREYYKALTNDLVLRYTGGGGPSTFFYVDNFALVKGLDESAFITSFNKDSNNSETTRQKLTMDNVVGDKTIVYGISKISTENSSTMYIWLSFDYMGDLFADSSVTAITFDVILSTETAQIQGPGNANEVLQNGATSSNGSYYTYIITISREYYETLTSDLRLRYTKGGQSTFFYVDNLALVK